MLRRSLPAVLPVLLWMTASTCGATDAPRWNVLPLFADDWGRYASCYRGIDGRPGLNDVVSTPALDRLAREGVLFPSSRRGGCRTTFRNMRPG